MTTLTSKEKKYLRGQGMKREDDVLIGRVGLTPGVSAALRQSLAKKALVKVRFSPMERDERKRLAEVLAEETHACLCGITGHTALLYKEPLDPALSLLPREDSGQ
jgi:RNA-binding protein